MRRIVATLTFAMAWVVVHAEERVTTPSIGDRKAFEKNGGIPGRAIDLPPSRMRPFVGSADGSNALYFDAAGGRLRYDTTTGNVFSISSEGITRVGLGLYPSVNNPSFSWRYDVHSALLVNTIGARNYAGGLLARDVGATWANAYINGIDSARGVTFYGINPVGASAGAFVTRSSDSPWPVPHHVIAEQAMAVQDNGTTGHLTWVRYTYGVVERGAAPSHLIGEENTVANARGDAGHPNPYDLNPANSVENLRLDTGFLKEKSVFRASAALTILNVNKVTSSHDRNSAIGRYWTGIVIGDDAIDRSVFENPCGLCMPHSIATTWWGWDGSKPLIRAQVFADNAGVFHITHGQGADSLTIDSDAALRTHGPTIFGGGIRTPSRAVLTALDAPKLDADHFLCVIYTQKGPVSISLPAGVAGAELIIKDCGGDASKHGITIASFGDETIDGRSRFVITHDFQSVRLKFVNGQWSVL